MHYRNRSDDVRINSSFKFIISSVQEKQVSFKTREKSRMVSENPLNGRKFQNMNSIIMNVKMTKQMYQ